MFVMIYVTRFCVILLSLGLHFIPLLNQLQKGICIILVDLYFVRRVLYNESNIATRDMFQADQ